jgi:N6-adenosine-specific RNA methylase IME4
MDLFEQQGSTGQAQSDAPRPRFGAIVADPPWLERGGGKIKRGADRHYPLMATSDICQLPVKQIASPSAHLYLWVTNNFLPDGLRVMEAWGFRYVTNVCWVKDRNGLGQYFRGRHELCLFGVRGETHLPDVAPSSVLESLQESETIGAPRGRHSEKPAALLELAERVSLGPRLELFARSSRDGWTALGNQAPGTGGGDLRQQLDALAQGFTAELVGTRRLSLESVYASISPWRRSP